MKENYDKINKAKTDFKKLQEKYDNTVLEDKVINSQLKKISQLICILSDELVEENIIAYRKKNEDGRDKRQEGPARQRKNQGTGPIKGNHERCGKD